MPYWYTVFYQAYKEGLPVMRPIWAHYPTEAVTFDMDDQWLIGADLLVKPVTAAGTPRSFPPMGLFSCSTSINPPPSPP